MALVFIDNKKLKSKDYSLHVPYKRKRGPMKVEEANQKDILLPKINDGLLKEHTLGITGSES